MTTDGIISQSGRKYLAVQQNDRTALVPLEALYGSASSGALTLRSAGIANYSGHQIANLKDIAEKVTSWRPTIVVEHPGWNTDTLFCLTDGEVLCRDDASAFVSTVTRQPTRSNRNGNHRSWLTKVAKPLEGQSIPITLCSFALLPALRPFAPELHNLGLQLVGSPGTGKTTMLQLVHSMWASPCDPTGHPAIQSSGAIFPHLDMHMTTHNDHLLMVDDIAHFSATITAKACQRQLHEVVGKLVSGAATEPICQAQRLCFLFAGNQALSDLVGSIPTGSVLGRVPVISIPQDSQHGIFNKLPRRGLNGSTFANQLLNAARQHHGHALPMFVEKLMEQEKGYIERRIQRSIASFRERAAVDLNDGAQVRLADHFGLTYAAGCLGQMLDCLPRSWKIGPAVLRCYRAHQRSIAPPAPFFDRLIQLIEGDVPLGVPTGGFKIGTKKRTTRINSAAAFVSSKPSGTEIFIRPSRLEEVLPGASLDRGTPDFRQYLVSEGDRLGTKRKIWAKGEQERFYVFRLPAEVLTKLSEAA